MDTEKGNQADASFQNQPHWASCQTCRATQKKQFILKSIFGFVLLGLLALSSYQSIHALLTKVSSLQLEQHYATSIEAQGHHNLSLTVESPSTTDDAPWAFTAFTKKGCAGNVTNDQGNGTTIQCQPFDQVYNAVSVSSLDISLKLCLYPKNNCGGIPVEVTDKVDCKNIPKSRAFKVPSNTSSCLLQLM